MIVLSAMAILHPFGVRETEMDASAEVSDESSVVGIPFGEDEARVGAREGAVVHPSQLAVLGLERFSAFNWGYWQVCH